MVLGAFVKQLQKATSSPVTSVRPSTWNSPIPTERILVEFHSWDLY